MSKSRLPSAVTDIFTKKGFVPKGADFKAVSHPTDDGTSVEAKDLIRFLLMTMRSRSGNREKVLNMVDQVVGKVRVTPDLFYSVEAYMKMVKEGEGK